MDERPTRRPRSFGLRPSVVACGLVAAFLFGPLAARAEAHATLIGTTPADDEVIDAVPEQVELRFDEPVEVVEGGIEVIDPAGDRADRGEVEVTEDGAVLVVPIDGDREGTYTVAWRVVSEDSHNLTSSFVFHVGVRTGAAELDDESSSLVDLVGGVGRWAGFAGAFMVVGAGALAVYAPVDAKVRRRLRTLMLAGALVAAVGVAASLVAQSADASGRSLIDAIGITPDLALDTRTGELSVVRIGALLAAAVLVAVPMLSRFPLLAVGAGVGSLVCASLSGHAWTAPNRALSVPVDVAHLVAVGVWLGGLVGLAATVRAATDRSGLVRRFSNAALVAVGVVAVSGGISSLVQVDSWEALGSTGYGQLLLVKVAGFAVLVALGFVNREVLLPRIEQKLTSLLWSVRGEVGVAAAVLVVTAVLVNQPPARDQVTGPITLTAAAADAEATVQAVVDPAEVGVNDIHLYFYDESGTEPFPVDAVEVTAAVGDIPARRLTVTPFTPSHVSLLDASLSSPGTWVLQVTAVEAGLPATFTLEVPLR